MDKKFQNLTWHYDASHAWLQVSLKQLEKLHIKEKISPFSYYTHNKKSEFTGYAFLEEDCDATILRLLCLVTNIKVTVNFVVLTDHKFLSMVILAESSLLKLPCRTI